MAEMTLQEAFDAHIKGRDKAKDSALINNFKATLRDLEKAGFPPSTPVSQLNTEKSITDLQKWATTERFVDAKGKVKVVGSGMFASRVKTLINAGIGPEEVNVLSNFEKANRGAKDAPLGEKEFGIRFTRAARKLELPSFDDFNSAIDATARQLTDKEAKAFLMIKTLTGLRNPDILKLQVGNAVEGAKYGSFDPQAKKLYNLSNKGGRINYDLGEIVHGILADLAADAQAEGRTQLFTQSEDKIRSTINPIMRSNMKSMGLEIKDLSKNKVVDFSVRDLRKNIFDILEEEIGAADANKVLGHSEKADVGLNHYKVERKSRRSLSRLQSAQEIFSNLYMESIGFDSPQTLFGSDGYGFANDNFKPATVVPLTIDAPAEQQAVESQTRTATAQASGAVDRSVDSLENKIKKLEGLMGQVQSLTEQTEELGITDDKVSRKEKTRQSKINNAKTSISSMISNFGENIDPDTLKGYAVAALGTAASLPVIGKLIKPAAAATDAALTALDVAGVAEQGASTQQQMLDLGVPSTLATAAGTARGIGEFVMGAPQPVVPDPLSSRPIERVAADDPTVAQSLQSTGQIEQPSAPIKIPDPVAPKPQMAAQGFVPVPEARANAMRLQETTMKESEVPSFLYGGIVR